LLKLVQEYL